MSDERNWILSSSGANALYLENVVRSLALPEGEFIQYRYEQDIVSDSFLKKIEDRGIANRQSLAGDTAILCYLDNRDTSKPPAVYPIRQAQIVDATLRGTTVIINLKLFDFVNRPDGSDLQVLAKDQSIDTLPTWIIDKEKTTIQHGGYWVAEAEFFPNECFVQYSADEGTHLLAFESAVNTIMKGEDFKDSSRMFANILQLRDITKDKAVTDGTIVAGRAYELAIYHYQSQNSVDDDLQSFWLEITSENDDIVFVSKTPRSIEARYDEVKFSFRVKDDAWASKANLNISIFRKENDKDKEPVYSLRSKITLSLASNLVRRVGFGSAMGLGLFMTQYVSLSVNDKATDLTYIGSFLFSMLVGMGAAFQFRTKP